jgi:uncharacterized protein (DUF433 family)
METVDMTMTIQADPVPLKMDEDGAIRVGGTRVTLDLVIAEHQLGATPEQIAAAYDTVPLPDVYAALTYYLRHRGEIDAYLERRRHEAVDLRREAETRFPREGLRERLLARRG